MIQDIKVNQRDPPALHKEMVVCLNNYGLNFVAVNPSMEIQREMPLWYHPGKNPQKRQVNNGEKARCLRGKHVVLKVGDGMDLAQRLQDPTHEDIDSCECEACDRDRTVLGCENPHVCAKAVAARLNQILPSWIPGSGNNVRPNAAEEPRTIGDDTEYLLPTKSISNLAQGLRVLTHRAGEPNERPDTPARRRRRADAPETAVTKVYIAGAVHAPPRQKAAAASGIYIGAENNKNQGKCIPVAGEQSQYAAELFAALEAIKCANRDSQLTIISTQKYIREAVNKKLHRWEHEGWVGVPHRDVLRCIAAELKARKAPTLFKIAEPDSQDRIQCRQAAKLAKRAANARTQGNWDLTIPKGTGLPGLSLQGNRQKIFYRSIREMKTSKVAPRQTTEKILTLVKGAVKTIFHIHVSSADIWKAVAVKDILPRTAQFLWKGLHGAHRIGKYWTHIPECDDRAECQKCQTTEDLEHILIKCDSPEREIIWKAAEQLWLETEPQWPEVTLGTILGCGLADFRDETGKLKRGTQRLYRILISESAYLIWRLRNDRVISRAGTPATTEEIVNRWKFTINQRLQVDIALASRPMNGKRPALVPKLVLETWSGTLDDGHRLLANWLREPRVLVGKRAFPQTQPQRLNSQGIG
ncbi:hypothetical protein DFH07DRAFT_767627 [Mycena maculata]|uniref:RNase H type-1 domain-containing protein n=1 Tax=Mycena maculata TaxID=230809 RepID=A0AAD7JXE3_9AGAR|nr:hypothetical protein DFH07DRAFT_767627 [Mycena maculata]